MNARLPRRALTYWALALPAIAASACSLTHDTASLVSNAGNGGAASSMATTSTTSTTIAVSTAASGGAGGATSTSPSSSAAAACGWKGQPCCAGDTCNVDGLVCQGGTCVSCGELGAPCCTADPILCTSGSGTIGASCCAPGCPDCLCNAGPAPVCESCCMLCNNAHMFIDALPGNCLAKAKNLCDDKHGCNTQNNKEACCTNNKCFDGAVWATTCPPM